MAGEKDRRGKDDVVNRAGLSQMHPPDGGPNADPDAPDPEDLVPNRQGIPQETEEVQPEGSRGTSRAELSGAPTLT